MKIKVFATNHKFDESTTSITLSPRDYCKKNSLDYLLSASEYKMKNSFLILSDLISNFNDIFGIVAYSLFQLPSDYNERNKI